MDKFLKCVFLHNRLPSRHPQLKKVVLATHEVVKETVLPHFCKYGPSIHPFCPLGSILGVGTGVPLPDVRPCVETHLDDTPTRKYRRQEPIR